MWYWYRGRNGALFEGSTDDPYLARSFDDLYLSTERKYYTKANYHETIPYPINSTTHSQTLRTLTMPHYYFAPGLVHKKPFDICMPWVTV